MDKAKIKCSVSDCYYNKKMMCEAGNIEVKPMGDGTVNTSDGTKCSTFIKETSV